MLVTNCYNTNYFMKYKKQVEKLKNRVDQVRQRLEEIRKEQFIIPGAEKRADSQVAFLEMDQPVFSRKTLQYF